MSITLRRARAGDLAAIAGIEASSFPRPWSRALFERELGNAWSTVLVAEDESGVHGFIVFWIIQDEVHLLDMAVAAEARRSGVGAALLGACIDAAREHRAAFITLEVRRSNAAAQGLYASRGFEPVGVRPRYYEAAPHSAQGREDAIIMELVL